MEPVRYIIEDEYLSIPALAKRANARQALLRDSLHKSNDPLPSVMFGSHPKVLWSQYVAWVERNYGVNGPLRGTER